MHGEDAGIENVYLVDFLGSDNAKSPCNGIFLDYLAKGIAALLGELLGVVEKIVVIIRRKDDGCGIYTAGKTTAASLIATSFY